MALGALGCINIADSEKKVNDNCFSEITTHSNNL